MQVTIEVEPSTFSLLERVKEKGVSLDKILREGLAKFDDSRGFDDSLSPSDWIASLKNWASQTGNVPDVPTEALRRENLYEDRF